ncbi:Kinase family protein [Quillaja saponaria]|uniref:RING-type E3 ubiquitin transferase n=1 Tax=Quillaja saponaria TaxID=32244 RepID=A0AAD7P658_QUISA|nr:Kinase family protein [Quillaja saponaria]KAJ7943738.1 Kinase family protein [Quillaja saponaria]
MNPQAEKVYVAIGNDQQDGFKTLDWTLKKWKSHPISIVILHVAYTTSMDYVSTPFGKLPARYVNDEKIEDIKKVEQEKIDKLLSKYIAFCGQVHAEILKVEKYDQPIHRLIIDMISGLEITKLVMGFSFMNSSWRSKGAISGSFYVHQNKPEFCELYIICGGKQVFLKGNNDEKIMEDDNGVMVAKLRDKLSFRDWLGKMFLENLINSPGRSSRRLSPSSTNLGSPGSQNQWEFNLQEIENYFQELLSSNLIEEEGIEQDNDVLQISPTEPDLSEQNNSNMSVAEKIEILKGKLNEARKTIQLKRKEAKANLERHAKAEWVVCLCNRRVEELEGLIKEEDSNREELKKELEEEKEQLDEIKIDIEESRSRLSSVLELQSELSNKLQVSTLAKSRVEIQLEKAVSTRAEMVREIEELRRQKNVLYRRIEFCKEKDAIGMVSRLSETTCSFREYTTDEIRLATDDFSERMRLKSCGDFTNVYRGRINHTTVAIKMLNLVDALSQEDFLAKVKFLSNIRQPHVVAMIGFCSELKCIVLEYMHNGSLRDILLSSHRRSRKRNKALKWHDRIRIAAEICSGMCFLHAARPKPIIHCNLTSCNILLDRNLVAKIGRFGPSECHEECTVESDIRAFGVLMLQLLTGRNRDGLVEDAMMMDRSALVQVLDEMAGEWPLDLAEELAGLAMRCMSMNKESSMAQVMKELNEMRKKSDDLVAREGREVADRKDSSDVPGVFLCPIFQDVMKNPHVAEDGFSYELEAIEEWLQSGHDTSPMTNLRLKHRFLTPNHTLRSLIHDWQSKQSTGG